MFDLFKIFEKESGFRVFFPLVFYAAFLGVLYLWGYWSNFNFDILPLISLWDIIKFSAYPLFVMSGVAFVVSAIFHFDIEHLNDKSKFAKNPEQVPSKNVLMFSSIIVVLVTAMSATIFAAFLMTVCIIASVFLYQTEVLRNIQPLFRKLIISIVTILPILSYLKGINNANDVLNSKYLLTTFNIEGKIQTFKYLGQLNGHYFFVDIKNEKLLIRNAPDILVLGNIKLNLPMDEKIRSYFKSKKENISKKFHKKILDQA